MEHVRDVAAIAAGELRSLLRDRHTVIYSVLVPFLLYPALFVGMTQVVAIVKGAQERRIARVGLSGLDQAMEHRFRDLKIEVIPTPLPEGQEAESAESWIKSGAVDAVVRKSPGDGPAEVYLSGASEASNAAGDRIRKAFQERREEVLLARANSIGKGKEFLETLEVDSADLASTERRILEALARVIPILLVLMTAIGTFYPALEATVAERERATVETTLLFPVSRTVLMAGKFLPVAALSLLSVILNFASMGGALWFFFLQYRSDFRPEIPSAEAVFMVLAGAILLALLLSAVELAVALLARSFKEGQSYLGTVLLVAMIPGFAAAISEGSLNSGLALVPVVNLAVLVRDAVRERLEILPAAIALISSVVYAALAILAAGRLAERETVLLGSPAATPRRRKILAGLWGNR
jgi:sodium transport system permease protein